MSRHIITPCTPAPLTPSPWGTRTRVRPRGRLFGELVIAVATAHHKKTCSRWTSVRSGGRHCYSRYGNVSVAPFDGLVCATLWWPVAARSACAACGVTDFDYEHQLALHEPNLAPDVETVFLTPHGHAAIGQQHADPRDLTAGRRRGALCLAPGAARVEREKACQSCLIPLISLQNIHHRHTARCRHLPGRSGLARDRRLVSP